MMISGKSVLIACALLLGCLSGTGCVSLDDKKDELPKITDETPFPDAIEIAIKGGGERLEIVKKRAKADKKWDSMQQLSEKALLSGIESRPPEQLINAAHLYQVSTSKVTAKVVVALVNATRGPVRQIGWQLAALRSNAEIAEALEKELTKAVYENREDDLLVPEMAMAVRANRLTSVYTLMRQGLMASGDSEFARTMILFYPRQASADFMNYLSIATIEDLRQLNQKTVNQQTCYIILNHFQTSPPLVSHPRYSNLFFYAVSRNQVLRELANKVLEKQFPQSKEAMAIKLAQLPVWIQIAYIEGVRDQMTPNITVFLNQLQQVTSYKEVLEEISALRF